MLSPSTSSSPPLARRSARTRHNRHRTCPCPISLHTTDNPCATSSIDCVSFAPATCTHAYCAPALSASRSHCCPPAVQHSLLPLFVRMSYGYAVQLLTRYRLLQKLFKAVGVHLCRLPLCPGNLSRRVYCLLTDKRRVRSLSTHSLQKSLPRKSCPLYLNSIQPITLVMYSHVLLPRDLQPRSLLPRTLRALVA
jgi:hypothetical protein